MTDTFQSSRPLDTLCLEGMVIDCIVGMYPEERHVSQPLAVDIRLSLDLRAAGIHGDLSASVDYSRLCGELRFILQSGRFLMLEEAAQALASYLLAAPTPSGQRAPVTEAEVRLAKPRALEGLAVPSITVRRSAKELACEQVATPFGSIDILHASERVGLYRMLLNPGQRAELYLGAAKSEAELVLDEGCLINDRPAAPGDAFVWAPRSLRCFSNSSDTAAALLAVYRPAATPAGRFPNPLRNLPMATVEPRSYYGKRQSPPAA